MRPPSRPTIHSLLRRGRTGLGYLLAMALGAQLVIMFGVVGLYYLDSRNSLPPPQISNSICIDEKLARMRSSPPTEANFLVVGSSVAWRHFNSEVAAKARPGLRPFNAGFCGTKISQTAEVTRWMVRRNPDARFVLLIASPIDFTECAEPKSSTFDVEVADDFVYRRNPLIFYYTRYFDPGALVSNARDIAARRRDMTDFDSLMIDRWGDGPIEPVSSRGLHYTEMGDFDPACFVALNGMARDLHRAGIGFQVALTPVSPQWRRAVDSDNSVRRELHARIRRALAGTSGRFEALDMQVGEPAFFDAIHLRWSATPAFTRTVLTKLPSSGLG